MPRRASESSNAALAFVLAGGSYEDALKKYPDVSYKNLWDRACREKKKRFAPSQQLVPAAKKTKGGSNLGSCRRTSKQVTSDWKLQREQKAAHKVLQKKALEYGGEQYTLSGNWTKACRLANQVYPGAGLTTYLLRQNFDGSSPAKRGRPAAKGTAEALAVVASYSRCEQLNGVQHKPKELGGLVLDLLDSASGDGGGSGSGGSSSGGGKSALQKAARLARDLRRAHPELDTVPLGQSQPVFSRESIIIGPFILRIDSR